MAARRDLSDLEFRLSLQTTSTTRCPFFSQVPYRPFETCASAAHSADARRFSRSDFKISLWYQESRYRRWILSLCGREGQTFDHLNVRSGCAFSPAPTQSRCFHRRRCARGLSTHWSNRDGALSVDDFRQCITLQADTRCGGRFVVGFAVVCGVPLARLCTGLNVSHSPHLIVLGQFRATRGLNLHASKTTCSSQGRRRHDMTIVRIQLRLIAGRIAGSFAGALARGPQTLC